MGAGDLLRSCCAAPDCCRFIEAVDALGVVPAASAGEAAVPWGLPETEVRRVSCCAGLEPCRFGGDTPAAGGMTLPGGRAGTVGGVPTVPDCSLVRLEVCSTVVRSEWTFSRRVERVSVDSPGALCPGAAPLPGTAAALPGSAARCRTAFSPA